jgi:ERCC4-type nuclease
MIEIDIKEKDTKLIEYLKEHFETNIVNLKYGDYHVVLSDYYIERKSWDDLWGSITNGNLVNQLINMIDNNLNFLLVIHGKPSFIYTSNPFLHKMQCYKQALSYLLTGIKVFFAEDNYNFRLILEYLDKKTLEKELTQKDIKIKHITPPLRLLTSIKGIGMKKAEKLLNDYGDIKNIMSNINDIQIADSIKNNMKSAFML